jgi:hypothetical protein
MANPFLRSALLDLLSRGRFAPARHTEAQLDAGNPVGPIEKKPIPDGRRRFSGVVGGALAPPPKSSRTP